MSSRRADKTRISRRVKGYDGFVPVSLSPEGPADEVERATRWFARVLAAIPGEIES